MKSATLAALALAAALLVPAAITTAQEAAVDAPGVEQTVTALQSITPDDPNTEETEQPTVTDVARVVNAGTAKGPLADTRAIGIGLVIMGAGIGIGWLTRSAVESMARQPETAGNVQTAMIISAALIEGVTFFALIVIGFILTTY